MRNYTCSCREDHDRLRKLQLDVYPFNFAEQLAEVDGTPAQEFLDRFAEIVSRAPDYDPMSEGFDPPAEKLALYIDCLMVQAQTVEDVILRKGLDAITLADQQHIDPEIGAFGDYLASVRDEHAALIDRFYNVTGSGMSANTAFEWIALGGVDNASEAEVFLRLSVHIAELLISGIPLSEEAERRLRTQQDRFCLSLTAYFLELLRREQESYEEMHEDEVDDLERWTIVTSGGWLLLFTQSCLESGAIRETPLMVMRRRAVKQQIQKELKALRGRPQELSLETLANREQMEDRASLVLLLLLAGTICFHEIGWSFEDVAQFAALSETPEAEDSSTTGDDVKN